MLDRNSLPPFIHPRLVAGSGAAVDEMEPLHNCISLLHMMNSQVPGSRKLFWRNVRAECERFLGEYHGWKKQGLLAALQALSVYLIPRLGEGETQHNNFDSLLIAAVVAISTQFSRVEVASDPDPLASWDDWILEESKRGLCVIFQVVGLLFYFEPAGMCNVRRETNLVIAPLPSRKQLWEARDELAWRAEVERDEAEARTAFALAANGDLVKLEDQDHLHCVSDAVQIRTHRPVEGPLWTTTNWDEWCSGMDALGGLIMLAASLTA
ncbi:7ae919f1-8516-4992-a306-67b5314558d6 [Thermothielavioides terrestris]|nr:7ae919f1-8516-4992-a306-67b5314558d6 [Thermothielavioides terrestris]